MSITIKKDGEGFLAEVVEKKNIYAYGLTKAEALKELANVADMMTEYYEEELSWQKNLKKQILLDRKLAYAV